MYDHYLVVVPLLNLPPFDSEAFTLAMAPLTSEVTHDKAVITSMFITNERARNPSVCVLMI